MTIPKRYPRTEMVPCRVCREPFPQKPHTNQVLCSDPCRAEALRLRRAKYKARKLEVGT